MKVSIVIPQLFYDLIARILPGFFFLILIIICNPDIYNHITIMDSGANHNFVESIGLGIYYLVISYFLGWLFYTFKFSSRERSARKITENDLKSLKTQYQWIRLSNPAAGFRIVKLRAEARMLETTRTAMVVVFIIVIISFLVGLIYPGLISAGGTNQFSIRHGITLIIALSIFVGFYRKEKEAWDTYWGNIKSIYKILHDKDDPIAGSKENK